MALAIRGRWQWIVLATVCVCQTVFAKPSIQTIIDPDRSRNGEPIMFKITVRHALSDRVDMPADLRLKDFDIINRYNTTSSLQSNVNGRISATGLTELTFILRPLKTGLLEIPPVELVVGQDKYGTFARQVTVDKLPGGLASRPPQSPRGLPPLPRQSPGPQTLERPNFNVPERESFFVRAEHSKLDVYVGQLVTVSYSLFRRNASAFDDPVISKFPDFKGFLKEELNVPKTFQFVPVEIQGQVFQRTELIKYALFPLRSGSLRVQPLNFKATLFPSQGDIFDALLNGRPLQNGGQGFPTEKSSQELLITARDLPAAPAGTPFTGGVGQFELKLNGATQIQAVENQPFNVSVTISGTGNVKSIEEPAWVLPKAFEPFQSKNQYEFRPDATGDKTFEYLFVARQSGDFEVPPLQWAYFDPNTAQYKTLSTAAIRVQVAPNTSGKTSPTQSDAQPAPKTFAPWDTGTQSWVPLTNDSLSGRRLPKFLWLALVISFVGWIWMNFFYRRQVALEAHFAQEPWALTERTIRAKKSWSKKELSSLVDLWSRQRLKGLLNAPHLDVEAPRDEFFAGLEIALQGDQQRHADVVRRFWSDLDFVRFSGLKSDSQKVDLEIFERAQRILETLEKDLKRSS
jgi:hypothetical protein